MIALFFAGQPKGSVDRFWTSWKDMRKLQGKRPIKIKQQFSLANQLWRSIKTRSNQPWDYKRLNIMSNIWAYHLWLEEGRNKASISLKKRFGENYKVGKESFCLKWVVKYWLRLSFKPSQPLPWGASNYLWGFVMILKPWWRNSSGDKKGREGKSIGWNGKNWLNQNMKEVWGLETWLCLMIPFWRSKLGGSWKTKILCFIKYLRLGFSQSVQLWKPKILEGGRMHGVVLYMGGMC